MTTTYGYIRTSRQRIQGTAGSDPEAQAHQLPQEGVPEANIHRDVGVSGGTGINNRAGWRVLNAKLVSGDTLVVVAHLPDRPPLDGHGKRGAGPATREVRIRSLAQTEATWVTYLAAEPELQTVSRRTRADLERARAEGKTLGPPPNTGAAWLGKFGPSLCSRRPP